LCKRGKFLSYAPSPFVFIFKILFYF
jgi:hypothetical protein